MLAGRSSHFRASILLLVLTVPRLNEHMTTGVIRKIHASEESFLDMGAKLLDLTVDLGDVFAHDCPPISHYRIALRDKVWLRQLFVAPGDEVEPGANLAYFSTNRDETLDGVPVRALHVSIAGILAASDWWE